MRQPGRLVKIGLLFILLLSTVVAYTANHHSDMSTTVQAQTQTATQPPPSVTQAPTTQAITVPPTVALTEVPTAPVIPSPTEILNSMTLEEKVGQLFFARCPTVGATEHISQYALGGYIFFARDFQGQTMATMQAKLQSFQSATKVKMFLGVDEEGGSVNRVSLYNAFRTAPFLSPQALFELGGFELIRTDATEKAALLKLLGINLNFAPVCDVSTDPSNYIYKRSFGRSAEETAQFVTTVVQQNQAAQMGSVLKHFPGYGACADTHTSLVHDERPIEQFRSIDFLPFKAGIAAGAPFVLVAHNIVHAVDPTFPASLSPAVHTLLRNELGFAGLIITDDIAMGAIAQYTNDSNAAVLAVKAGNDMLISSNYPQQIPSVIAAVRSGELSETQINDAVLRILTLKRQLNII